MDPDTCRAAEPFVKAWEAADVEALLTLVAPLTAACPVQRPTGLGGPYPLCADATVDGELRNGFVWSSGSEGGLTDLAGLRESLTRALAAQKPLLSIGCEVTSLPNRCSGDFSLIFGLYPYGQDVQQIGELVIQRSGAELGLIGLLPVFVLPCAASVHDGECALLNGGSTRSHGGYRYWGDERGLPPSLPDWTFFRWTR